MFSKTDFFLQYIISKPLIFSKTFFSLLEGIINHKVRVFKRIFKIKSLYKYHVCYRGF